MGSDDGETVHERPGAPRAKPQRAQSLPGNRYVIGEQLGKGGMGEVVSARDDQIGRDVAIKRIRIEAPSDRLVQRFLHEARIQGRLEHPAIPPVHELGRDAEGLPFFAMKKLTGITLAAILDSRDARFSRQRLLRAFAEICLAVEFAHVNGVLHRDLKPSNIMLGEFGEVYVLDWGVAKVIGETDDFEDIQSYGQLTGTGTVVGTLGYMAPEQACGDEIDPRADVYALGRILAEILANEPVPELNALCERATATDRDQRVQTARELADAVQRYVDGDRDVELRRTLAREKLDQARTALATGDEGRAQAMKDAGSAMILDPKLDEASAFLAQLVLEPPKQIPAALKRELESASRFRHRVNVRGAAIGVLALLSLATPLVVNRAFADLVMLLLAVGVVGASTSLSLRRNALPNQVVIALCNAPVLMVVAYVFSPLHAAGIAATIVMSVATGPVTRKLRYSIGSLVILAGAILAPVLAQHAGWLATTLTATPGGWLLHGAGLGTGEAQLLGFGAAFIVTLVAAAVAIGHVIGAADAKMKLELQVMSWHLRQLLPKSV